MRVIEVNAIKAINYYPDGLKYITFTTISNYNKSETTWIRIPVKKFIK